MDAVTCHVSTDPFVQARQTRSLKSRSPKRDGYGYVSLSFWASCSERLLCKQETRALRYQKGRRDNKFRKWYIFLQQRLQGGNATHTRITSSSFHLPSNLKEHFLPVTASSGGLWGSPNLQPTWGGACCWALTRWGSEAAHLPQVVQTSSSRVNRLELRTGDQIVEHILMVLTQFLHACPCHNTSSFKSTAIPFFLFQVIIYVSLTMIWSLTSEPR
jgi:hypothetical protein